MTVPPPSSLRSIANGVDEVLANLLSEQHRRWASIDPELDEPIAEIERLVLGGGKRLRPAFCYWGFVGAGGEPDAETILRTGGALELLHAFALFHDDIMDDAASRRGQPTTHIVFEQQHREAELPGESRRFGEGIAILVGDLTFVYSDMLLTGANQTAWNVWNDLRAEVSVGQLLDILGSARGVRDVAHAERIATYKSAKYTVERPLHLGAALAAPQEFPRLEPLLSAYGLPLGVAFQMRDDVMGVFGDASVTGKPVGDDLVEGKPTPLLARALEASSPAQAEVLSTVGDPTLDAEGIARIQQTITDTGALADLESEISALRNEAIDAVARLGFPAQVNDELIALADFATQRTV